jgi:hypothetical protein
VPVLTVVPKPEPVLLVERLFGLELAVVAALAELVASVPEVVEPVLPVPGVTAALAARVDAEVLLAALPVLAEPDPEPLKPPVEAVEPALSPLLPVDSVGPPVCEISAWASPDPLASAAPTPSVTAPAPSHREAWPLGRSAWRRPFLRLALPFAGFFDVRAPAIAAPD